MIASVEAVVGAQPDYEALSKDYDAMSVPVLRTLVRERGLAKGAAVASAPKSQLVSLLRGEIEGLSQPDLADVIADALRGRITAGIDEEAVTDLIGKLVPGMIERAVAGREPLQVVLNGVKQAVIDEHTHACFTQVLELVACGLPVLLVGPAGTGKTTLASQIAKALGRRFSFNSMSAGVSESHLIGRTLPDSTGNWSYKPAPFVTTYEQGGVHLFDEVDAADPNLMVLINAALANGHLSIPFEDMIVHRHEECAIICAANTYGTGASRQYVGRNALDAATLDRFAVSTIEVGYDRVLERSLAGQYGLSEPAQRKLLDWCWGVRAKIEEASLRRIMSTRTLVNMAKRIAMGISTYDEVCESYFTGWSKDEKARVQ